MRLFQSAGLLFVAGLFFVGPEASAGKCRDEILFADHKLEVLESVDGTALVKIMTDGNYTQLHKFLNKSVDVNAYSATFHDLPLVAIVRRIAQRPNRPGDISVGELNDMLDLLLERKDLDINKISFGDKTSGAAISRTALFTAVDELNGPLMEKLLDRGANPNLTLYGYPPLIHIFEAKPYVSAEVQTKLLVVSRLLLDYGANINQTAPNGTSVFNKYATPLSMAISTRATEVSLMFLRNKAIDLSLREGDPNDRGPNGRSWSYLHQAIFRNEPKVVKRLLDLGMNPRERIKEDYVVEKNGQVVMKKLTTLFQLAREIKDFEQSIGAIEVYQILRNRLSSR